MDYQFETEKELYDRLVPALRTKEIEFKRNGMDYIHQEDIWNYLKITKWCKSRDLYLYQMVDDIINIDDYKIDSYVKMLIAKKREKPILDNDLNNK